MSEERKKVLEMLGAGKISVEEAERLLGAIGEAKTAKGGGAAPRYLRVTVESLKGDNVNVRVPMQLIRAGMKFQSLIPEHARGHVQAKLNEHGVSFDLARLKPEDFDEFVQALTELEVNVDSENGEKVRVFCE
ncbi:MAG TPA: hypothetical protein ENN09_03325 [Planctomycetes bacterium]|nr:hypothetical protein [Planctomycetota bacterium]